MPWLPSPTHGADGVPVEHHLLGGDERVRDVAARAALLGRIRDAEHVRLGRRLVELARKLARLLPRVRVRRDVLLREAADAVTELGVLFGLEEVRHARMLS